MRYTVIQAIVNAIMARENCDRAVPRNTELYAKWEERILQLQGDCLPSGSGVDAGTTIDLEKSSGDRVVLETAFHHMNDGGYYCGWTHHTIVVRPAFTGLDITIKGRDRNDIKEYLQQIFDHALTQEAPIYAQPYSVRPAGDAVQTGGA